MSFALPTARKRKDSDKSGIQIRSLRLFQPQGGDVPFAQLCYDPGASPGKARHLWILESRDSNLFRLVAANGSPEIDEEGEEKLRTAIRYLLVGTSRGATPIEVPIIGTGRAGRYLCPYCLQLEPIQASRFRPNEILDSLTCRGPLGVLSLPRLKISVHSWLSESYVEGGVCSLLIPGRRLQQFHVPEEFRPRSLAITTAAE